MSIKRVIVCLTAMLMIATGVSTAQADDAFVPRRKCSVQDLMPVVTFDRGVSQPKNMDEWFVRWIIRSARECRYAKLSITVFLDGDDSKADNLAQLRAEAIKDEFTWHNWPFDGFAISYDRSSKPLSGSDFGRTWNANAKIGFASPNSN
jgi:hypothetical protein